ncbi:MAG: hypothetical protein ABW212_17720 [Pseudonocardia sediminis]
MTTTHHRWTDDATATVPIPIARPARSRRPVTTIALAVVLVLVVGAAVAAGVVLLTPADPAPGPALPVPAAAAAPPSPAATAPADGPAERFDSGEAVPAPVASGARALYSALATADLDTVRTLYRPTGDGPSWGRVRPQVSKETVRRPLLTALRTAPTAGEDVAVLYTSGSYAAGFSSGGQLVFLDAGVASGGSARSAPTAAPRSETTDDSTADPADPYGCLAAERAGLSSAEDPCSSHFHDATDPTLMEPDTPATRWALCHGQASADDPDYLVGARKRYC